MLSSMLGTRDPAARAVALPLNSRARRPGGPVTHILDGVSFSVFYFSAFGNHIVMDGK
jgi:hypothetical protein